MYHIHHSTDDSEKKCFADTRIIFTIAVYYVRTQKEHKKCVYTRSQKDLS